MSTLRTLTEAIKGDASVDEAEDVLALLLLTDPQHLGHDGRALLDRFGARSKIDPGLDAAALERAVSAYLAQHPLRSDVVARLKDVGRALADKGAPATADVQRALALLGRTPATTPLGGGVRPQGTVAGGPFARAALGDIKPRRRAAARVTSGRWWARAAGGRARGGA